MFYPHLKLLYSGIGRAIAVILILALALFLSRLRLVEARHMHNFSDVIGSSSAFEA